jgi:UDP-N-acetylmuramyl pentapeptide phosphotransferase/UDP-N-acetylglucosamine-1-phosphate transferase
MNSKALVWIFASIGSILGSLIPNLWGASVFSLSSLFFGTLGAVAGIYLGFKINN